MAAGALIFLVLVLLGYYYYAYIMPKSCKADADCTAPKTCQSGSCAATGTGTGTGKGTAQPEVYFFDNGRYAFATPTAAQAAVTAVGLTATIATLEQVNAAQKSGANWCDAGWDDAGDQSTGVWPSDGSQSGCGVPGVVYLGGPPPYGVNLYGVKPAQSKFPNTCTGVGTGAGGPACVLPFNQNKWSQYS